MKFNITISFKEKSAKFDLLRKERDIGPILYEQKTRISDQRLSDAQIV